MLFELATHLDTGKELKCWRDLNLLVGAKGVMITDGDTRQYPIGTGDQLLRGNSPITACRMEVQVYPPR